MRNDLNPSRRNVDLMLDESNKIEGVYDSKFLQDARKAWKFIMQFNSINRMVVQETHKILMQHQDIEHKYKGSWRDVPVSIGYKIKSQPPLVIDAEVGSLLRQINELNEDPIQLHIKFEDIHPFIDGNGRIGRILMNWQSVKQFNQLIVFFDTKKQEYYRLFR